MHLDMNAIRKLKFYQSMDDGTRVCTVTFPNDQMQGAPKGAIKLSRVLWGIK